MPRRVIRVETLGRFSVKVMGRSMPVGRKAPRRPLGLLKYLLAHNGSELPEAQVAQALWRAGDRRAAGALAVALHRLRRLLGVPQAIVRRGGRIGIDPRAVWCDAASFERLVERAARSRRKRDRVALAARAVAMYRGDFLAGDPDADWAATVRERLRGRLASARDLAGESVPNP